MELPHMVARLNPMFRWWLDHVVTSVDHNRVMDRVRDDAGWSGRYAFMVLMSAGIAVLGLLLSSPAVVIGAMLISPLMGPIIGLGFGLATFDSDEIRTSASALALGTVLAILFTAALVLISPLQNVTDEIAARTRPNLFDLMVALFSALAGAYAMVRGREGTVVGVAIATALMPPLAVVGFGLATTNWTVFGGALLLFLTNLMTIALAAAVMARLYGFGSHLTPQHTLLQTVLVIGSFVALAIPLGLSLRQIAWETASSRTAREVVAAQFAGDARLSQIEINYARDPISVAAVVLTPKIEPQAERAAAARLTDLLDRPVRVSLEQYRVGTSAQAEAAQIAAARGGPAGAAGDRVTQRIVAQLAVAAGVASDQILVDPANHRILVNATPLPGATMAAYRTLEARVGSGASGWSVELVPPMVALGPVGFDGDEPDTAGADAIATAIWAGQRLKLPVTVTGPAEPAGLVAERLTAAGVAATVEPSGGEVRLAWALPVE
ncbi:MULTISPECIES: DUF389 domain-containing protein [unclassified Sphingomonas]|jgi:uncharacterized hydrophobic protein (TIGR00271 family)|uniref:DUF389 domain-containing protein n=1 Tax=unclassified Sphingomonas TaxID=196159 RepID=UPI001E33B682|nr:MULTISPECIES: DUF389 domain-containing protein [unclassified Sphingomonas]